jgi:cysteine desulfurase
MEVYLDNSATTKPYEEVIEVMDDVMRNYYGNPSSAHLLGFKAEQKLNTSREIIANSLNCSKEEIIFTSGGSESNNFLLKGFARKDSHIVTTKIEHPSILNTCKVLETSGVRITYLNVDNNGKVNLDELTRSIDKDTQVVSIMIVNNEIGVIQDIEKIGSIIKEKSKRAKFHVDAVQGYGKINIDVQKSKIDLLSISGHKIHGPRGIGAAYLRKGLDPLPLISGGGQERSFRAGTENVAAVVGMAKAAEIIYKNKVQNYNKVEEIKNYFIEKLKVLPNVKINSESHYLPYILSASFIGVRGEVLLHMLEEQSIYVSTGSACSAKDRKESYVLSSIGLKKEEIKGTLRFSFSEFNTKKDIDYTVYVLEKSLTFLRRMTK